MTVDTIICKDSGDEKADERPVWDEFTTVFFQCLPLPGPLAIFLEVTLFNMQARFPAYWVVTNTWSLQWPLEYNIYINMSTEIADVTKAYVLQQFNLFALSVSCPVLDNEIDDLTDENLSWATTEAMVMTKGDISEPDAKS